MIEVEVRDVAKTYNPGLFKKNVRAVNGLSFKVNGGEVFGLIGPNGAGKSTTIRMVMGLVRPDVGRILFRGKELSGTSFRREIGYLPENPYLYDHLTLEELLFFAGRTSGMEKKEIRLRAEELVERLCLTDVHARPLRTFSKGMLQRAGICFALLHDPSTLILDEPMSGLDPVGRKMVFDLVMELKRQGKTIFFCSHILNDVERLCDRIGLLNKGCLVREFSRNELLQINDGLLFLETRILELVEIEQIEQLGGRVREFEGGHLVAIPTEEYFSLNRYFEQSGIPVKGGRSEWLSLEDLFVEIVQEQAR
ncbi:ABC-2 type transport system ATP-binding protein [Malonomonas rubra DSM 5091]|uniref:ABC-2 type transport system ATP-binding protein n=1 Tax=Malonomonas rubra DSM 5091 TaxID=1122189 RepID=A0A1M6D8D3_MALRU|nr:ABC transporter ATP-binding protein [Malonomonas rubra]SHI69258.1 ABC-2 type transport system ATP-binding protein [Malonomonas rubra DSM 5091]